MSEREASDRSRNPEGRNSAAAAASSKTSRLLERGRKVERDARSLSSDLEGLLSEVEDLVRARLEAQPYATLAVAAGAGFVLGGGLTVGVVGTLARIGTRMATAALMQGALTRVLAAEESSKRSST